MAYVAGDARPIPIRGYITQIDLPIQKSDGTLIVTGTGSGYVSTDNGAAGAITPVFGVSNSGHWYVTFTAAQMAGETVKGYITSDATGALPTPFLLCPKKLVAQETGTATAGAAGTITLAAGASANNDTYNGKYIGITAGTGAGQLRKITGYVGSTKVATVEANWGTNPSTDSVYEILPDPDAYLKTVDVVSVNKTLQTAGDIYAAISGIGTAGGGAAINQDAATSNVSGGITGVTSGTTLVGSQTSGTYASTSNVNSVCHQITGTSTALDVVYQFLTYGGTTPIEVVWTGYVNSGNDIITIYAWNHVGGAWESLGTIQGIAGSANSVVNRTLYARHSGTSAAELGKVYIRFACTGMTNPVLNTDQVKVVYAITSRTIGYADGAIWVKATGTNATESYVNGTADNPCPWAAAQTIATALGLNRFRILNGETVTLTGATDSKSLIGQNWNLALNGQSVSGCYIQGASVTGTGSGASQPMFKECWINNSVSLPPSNFDRCGIAAASGTPFVGNAAGQYAFVDCFSLVPGSGTPYFTFAGTGGSTGVNIRRWSGGSNITLDSNCTLTMEVVTGGGQTVTTGGASVEIRGICRSVTVAMSAAETVQVDALTGPITLSGTTTATVNLYGVHGVITDTTSGATVNDYAVKAALGGIAYADAIKIGGETQTAGRDLGTVLPSVAPGAENGLPKCDADGKVAATVSALSTLLPLFPIPSILQPIDVELASGMPMPIMVVDLTKQTLFYSGTSGAVTVTLEYKGATWELIDGDRAITWTASSNGTPIIPITGLSFSEGTHTYDFTLAVLPVPYGTAAAVAAIPTNPLTSLGTNAPANWINAGAIASSAITSAKFATDAIAAAAIKADAVTKIQAGLATEANATTNRGTITSAISAIPPAPSSEANATAVRSELATELSRIDAAISTRSTYAGADTAGTTTLLTRVVGTLAAGYHVPQTGDTFTAIADISMIPAFRLSGAHSPFNGVYRPMIGTSLNGIPVMTNGSCYAWYTGTGWGITTIANFGNLAHSYVYAGTNPVGQTWSGIGSPFSSYTPASSEAVTELSDVLSAVQAIPTNPLLDDDTRIPATLIASQSDLAGLAIPADVTNAVAALYAATGYSFALLADIMATQYTLPLLPTLYNGKPQWGNTSYTIRWFSAVGNLWEIYTDEMQQLGTLTSQTPWGTYTDGSTATQFGYATFQQANAIYILEAVLATETNATANKNEVLTAISTIDVDALAGAVLATPANKLKTNASGQVETSNPSIVVNVTSRETLIETKDA